MFISNGDRGKLKGFILTASTMMFLMACFQMTVYAQEEPAADNQKINALISQLTGNSETDKAIRAQLRADLSQRTRKDVSSAQRAKAKSDAGDTLTDPAPYNPQELVEGVWVGELETFAMDHMDTDGNLVSSDINYHLLTEKGALQVFFLDGPPLESGARKKIELRGLKSQDRLLVEAFTEIAPAAAANDATANVQAGTLGCDSTGPQRSLVVAVNYQDDATASPLASKIDGYYHGASNSLADFWQEASYGKTQLTGDTLGWYTLDINSAQACNYTLVRQKALARAAMDTDLTQYNRIFIVMRNPNPGCGWAGLGTLSCSNLSTPDGNVYASSHWALSSYFNNANRAVFLNGHEGGHNIHLHHAAVRDYGVNATAPIGSTSGSLVEYGDRYDVMGSYARPNHYNADHKYSIGWLEDKDIIRINGNAAAIVEPISTTLTGIKALKVYRGVDPNNFGKEYFWLETRKQLGYDAGMDPRGVDAIHVHLQRYRPYAGSSVLSEAIDTHPNSEVGVNDYFDAPIYEGESFTDPYSHITVTHQGKDNTGNVKILVSTPADNLDVDEDGIDFLTENNYGTDPANSDTDGDGLTDYQEVCYDGDCAHYTPAPAGGDLNATNSDTDFDGMPDKWEIDNGLDPIHDDAALDPDQDGLTNLQEFQANTLPRNSDTDGDGLSDGDEVNIYHSNPNNVDTDGDGMRDGWEARYGLNLLDAADATNDNDHDGLSNLSEYQYGTNPNLADTDHDGLSDGDEVHIYHTNPTLPDTDFDGIDDGEEVQHHTDPLLLKDTDSDGMSDDWENLRGTQPYTDDARQDADGDQVDNIIEFIHRTYPRDALSAPTLKTVYVDALTGDDMLGHGTAASPFASTRKALDIVEAGDTIQFASGTYTESSFLFISKPVTFQGPVNRSVVLNLPYLYFSGLRWGGFHNVQLNVQSYFMFTATNGVFPGGRNFLLANVELRLGVPLMLNVHTKLLFEHVLVTNMGGASSAFRATDVTFNSDNRTELQLHNSTVAGFPLGIDWNHSVHLQVRNSILANTVDLQDIAANVYPFMYSLISDGQFAGSTTNLGGDPQFVDPANGNYHLLPISPAVDTADLRVSAQAEPLSTRLDMGFYGGTAEATIAQDHDGDGLPDGWEVAMGLNPGDPLDRLADSDGDGFNNTIEYRTGTLANFSYSHSGLHFMVLNPAQLGGKLNVMALVNATHVSGASHPWLNQFETTTVDTVGQHVGLRFHSNQPISVANVADGTDMPVSDWFLGHAFVLPHFRLHHRYHLYSPYGNAHVRININGVEQIIDVPMTQAVVFEAGSDNTRSGIVRSDLPIAITHTAYFNSGESQDVYAVPPAAREVNGIHSRQVVIGAMEDNTYLRLHGSDGSFSSFILNAGGRYVLPGGQAQGEGVALRINADKPIAAIQAADGDGIEATAFWDPIYSGRRYGLPIDTQYVAVACEQASHISLYDSIGTVLVSKSCQPSSHWESGKVYFGSKTSGVHIHAGSYLIGSEPFYMIYESSQSNDEKNIMGHL